MELNTNQDQYPGFCIESARIEADHWHDAVNNLEIGQLKKLVQSWVYEVIDSLMDPPELKRIFVTRDEACSYLDVTLPTLDGFIQSGKLPAGKLGGKVIILYDDLMKFVTNQIHQQ